MMSRIFKLLGFVFLVYGIVLLVDGYMDTDSFLETKDLGELWYENFPRSLHHTQNFVSRYIAPELWDPAILAILSVPAWMFFVGLGIILMPLGRRRSDRIIFK